MSPSRSLRDQVPVRRVCSVRDQEPRGRVQLPGRSSRRSVLDLLLQQPPLRLLGHHQQPLQQDSLWNGRAVSGWLLRQVSLDSSFKNSPLKWSALMLLSPKILGHGGSSSGSASDYRPIGPRFKSCWELGFYLFPIF